MLKEDRTLQNTNTISRRLAIFYLTASLPLFLLFPKTKLVKFSSVLSLPKLMSQDEFYNYQHKIIDIKRLHRLEFEMIKKKSMLFKETQLNYKKAQFTFMFKTIEDYHHWRKESYLCLKSKYFNKDNYYTEVKTVFV